MRRRDMLAALTTSIIALPATHPARVAIDGIDASGKTILADELAALIFGAGRPVIRASIDDFQRPRSDRYRRGAASPEGYYLDAFDYDALRESLLVPLGPGGSRRYRRAVFDYRADCPLDAPAEEAAENAVLILDGVFLLRPELVSYWDYRIFVETSFAVALTRAEARDVSYFGSAEAVRARYAERYFPAQRLYLAAAHPQERADVLVHNENPLAPLLAFHGAP